MEDFGKKQNIRECYQSMTTGLLLSLSFLETLPVPEHESEHIQQAGMVLYAGRIDILALP